MTGSWLANPPYNAAGTWTIALTLADGVLTGTVRQGNMGPCEPDAWAIQSGTTDGRNVSFIIVTNQGREVRFKGTLNPTGEGIDFVRSVPAASAEATEDLPAGIVSAAGTKAFTARRLPSSGLSNSTQSPIVQPARRSGSAARCLEADFSASPFAPNTQVRLVAEDVTFSPWTFDLAVASDGTITGSATQSGLDSKTNKSAEPGPFAVAKGAVWGEAIGFALTYDDGQGKANFHGVRRGADGVDLSCFGALKGITGEPIAATKIVNGRPALVAAPHADRGFLTQGLWWFKARILSSTALTSAPQDATSQVVPSQDDETVAITSIDDSHAFLTTGAATETRSDSPLAVVRYRVGAGFHGRLFLLALKDNGDRLRQFEVSATPGEHSALWNLRVEDAASAAATGAAQAAEPRAADLQAADERAEFVENVLQQVTGHPDDATGLLSKIQAALAGLKPAGGAVVPAGLYSLALARLDGAAFALLDHQALTVRPGQR